MSADKPFDIGIIPAGNRVQLLVRDGDTVLFADTCDPSSERSRTALVSKLTNTLPGLAERHSEIAYSILQLAGHADPQSAPAANPGIPSNPPPCDEVVDGIALAGEIRDILKKYIILPTHGDATATLWVIHSYVYSLFEYSPRLLIHGPEKRCGKSLLMKIVRALCAAPLKCDNITAAPLFRSIDRWHPTLLIDEADTIMAGPNVNEDLRGVVNAGHERTGTVIRCAGEDHEPTPFAVFGPLALAMIGSPPATIEDRSIPVPMRRKARGEQVDRLPVGCDLRVHFEPTLRRIARWAKDNEDRLRATMPAVPPGLDDRAADNWFALLVIAEVIGGDWPALARQAATDLQARRKADANSVAIELLADIRTLFEDGDEHLFTSEILRRLNAMEDRPWAEFSHGRPLNGNRLGSLLRPFGISSINIRNGLRVAKGYVATAFADPWARYLDPPEDTSPEAATSLQPGQDQDLRENSAATDAAT